MLSMIIAQLTSDLGLVSVDGRETVDWGVLVTSPASALVKIINSKRTEGKRVNESNEGEDVTVPKKAAPGTTPPIGEVRSSLQQQQQQKVAAGAPGAGNVATSVNSSAAGQQGNVLEIQDRTKPTN
jgi:hypothetical protein